MRFVIVKAGATLWPGAPPRRVLDALEGATVVAADGGADALRAWGVAPHLLVGDLDSASPEAVEWCAARGAEILRHPPEKLHTDAHLALEAALDRGATDVVFTGATGGRVDHTLANLMLLRRAAEAGARAGLVEPHGDAWTASPGRPLALEGLAGETVSVLPLGDGVSGVTLTGFKWPLENAEMPFTDPYGVSNVVAGKVARVTVARGVVVVARSEARLL